MLLFHTTIDPLNTLFHTFLRARRCIMTTGLADPTLVLLLCLCIHTFFSLFSFLRPFTFDLGGLPTGPDIAAAVGMLGDPPPSPTSENKDIHMFSDFLFMHPLLTSSF